MRTLIAKEHGIPVDSLHILSDHDKADQIIIDVTRDTNIDRRSIEFVVVYDNSNCLGLPKVFIEENEKRRENIQKKFPFARSQPAWVINLLYEKFNIDNLEQTLVYFNSGCDNKKEYQSDLEFIDKCHPEKISFLEI